MTASPVGGFLLAGQTGVGGLPDGLVLRVDDAGSVAWAVRTEGRALAAVAALPDGGAIVAGSRGLVARLLADGTVAWQADWGGPSSPMHAVACVGWDCAVAGSVDGRGLVAFIDGASGGVFAQAEGDDVVPMRLAWAPDGSLACGALAEDYPMVTATLATLEPDGTVRWARALDYPEWVDSPSAFTWTAIGGLVVHPDASVTVVWNNQWGEGFGRSVTADGTPLSGFATGGTIPAGAVPTTAGGVVVSTGGLRLEAFHRGIPVDAVRVGPAAGSTRRAVAGLTDGRLAAVLGATVTWVAEDLASLDACTDLRTDWLAPMAGPPVPGTGELGLAPAATVVPAPSTATWSRACLTPCLVHCESACDDGTDDDANGVADCADAACASSVSCEPGDFDGDGVVNRDDCRPADAAVWARPGSAVLTLTAWTSGVVVIPRLSWAPSEPATSPVDIVRGLLDELRATGTTATGTCVARRARGGPWYDSQNQGSPEDFWYVARTWNACGPGPWDSPGLEAGACR